MTESWNGYECEHAKADNWLSKGRVCTIDGQICFNYGKPELVAKCPAKKRFKTGGKVAVASPSPPSPRRPTPYGTDGNPANKRAEI